MDVYLIIQGSIQEERSRHLQEDLNASKEKYEKSLEEVKSVRDWCRSLSIPWDLKIRFVKANFPYWCYRLPRRKKRFEVCKTRFWPRRNNTLSEFNRCELYSNVNEGENRRNLHLISYWFVLKCPSFALPLDQKKTQRCTHFNSFSKIDLTKFSQCHHLPYLNGISATLLLR